MAAEIKESADNKHPSPHTLNSVAEANQQPLTIARKIVRADASDPALNSLKHETNADLKCTGHQNLRTKDSNRQ